MQNSINTIDDLDVSNKWKSRFHLLKNLGADELSHALILKSEAYRALSFKERMFLFLISRRFLVAFYTTSISVCI